MGCPQGTKLKYCGVETVATVEAFCKYYTDTDRRSWGHSRAQLSAKQHTSEPLGKRGEKSCFSFRAVLDMEAYGPISHDSCKKSKCYRGQQVQERTRSAQTTRCAFCGKFGVRLVDVLGCSILECMYKESNGAKGSEDTDYIPKNSETNVLPIFCHNFFPQKFANFALGHLVHERAALSMVRNLPAGNSTCEVSF